MGKKKEKRPVGRPPKKPHIDAPPQQVIDFVVRTRKPAAQ